MARVASMHAPVVSWRGVGHVGVQFLHFRLLRVWCNMQLVDSASSPDSPFFSTRIQEICVSARIERRERITLRRLGSGLRAQVRYKAVQLIGAGVGNGPISHPCGTSGAARATAPRDTDSCLNPARPHSLSLHQSVPEVSSGTATTPSRRDGQQSPTRDRSGSAHIGR